MNQHQTRQLNSQRERIFHQKHAPFIMKRGKGAYLYDYDGNKFLDFHLNHGSLILGHANPNITKWIKNTLSKGYIMNLPGNLDLRLAKFILETYPMMPEIQFYRDFLFCFQSMINTFICKDQKKKILCLGQKYKDFTTEAIYKLTDYSIEIIKNILKENSSIQAICIGSIEVNPVLKVHNSSFWKELKTILDEYQLQFILDNEYGAFRFERGFPFDLIKPDYIILGGIIGGGFPLYGLLSHVYIDNSPLFYEPLAYIAGIETIKYLKREQPNPKMVELIKILNNTLSNSNFKINSYESVFSIQGLQEKHLHILLEKGIYLRNAPESAQFLSSAHTDKDILKLAKILNSL